MESAKKYKVITVSLLLLLLLMGATFAYRIRIQSEATNQRESSVDEVEETEVEKLPLDTDNEEAEEEPEEEFKERREEEANATLAKNKSFTVCIDPGHGSSSIDVMEPVSPWSSEMKPGFVSGTSGVATGLLEKDLNLAVSLKLKDELQARGYTVVMTRETDRSDLTNIDRAEYANRAGADLFVRVHANSSPDGSARGLLMLVPSGENLRDTEVVGQSKIAGELVLRKMEEATGSLSNGVVERSDIAGFNWAEVPVILVEMGFMSNPEEDRLMSSPDYQDRIVEGIANGVEEYSKR